MYFSFKFGAGPPLPYLLVFPRDKEGIKLSLLPM